jgi:hypothetical protein
MTSSSAHFTTTAPAPHEQLIQMGTAYWVSKILHATAKLGLADQISAEPKSAAEAADALGVHAPSLHRLMRTLASLGVLSERSNDRFALTPLGEALKTGAPGSARSTLLSFCSPWFARGFDNIMHSLRTGKSGFEAAHGVPVFDYIGQFPEEAALLSEAMNGFHGEEPPQVAAAYDFSPFEKIVDIGGATGNMLSAILARYPEPRGILFDMPHVVRDAPQFLTSRSVADRVTIEAGNFFQSVPAGGDAYVLSHIIHDWSEDQCLTILGNVRKAMKPDGRLLIVEMVLPDGDEPHPGKILDIVMLVMPGGQERTKAEYATLLEKADFKLTRIVSTNSAVSVVEARPA